MPGSPAPGPTDGPGGLIVIVRPDPVATACALARNHGVEVTTGGADTASAVDLLLDRLAPAGEGPSPSPVLAPTPTAAAPTTTPVPHPTEAKLDELATGMRRAEALRDRTRQRVADELCRSLNSSLAIHPATLRQAAAELTEAMEASARARAGRRSTARRAHTAQAGTVGAFGAAAVAVGVAVAWPAGIAIAGVGAVSGLARQRTIRRQAREQLPALQAAEALALRRWERLAGHGADPADLEAVIRRYDPHTDVIGDLLGNHPAVRAAQRLADDRRQAWLQAWQVAADDPLATEIPSETGTAVDAVEAITTDTTNEAAETDEIDDTVDTTVEELTVDILVVVSPYDGLTEDEAHALHDRLLGLPTDVGVFVVISSEVLDDAGDLSDGPTADQATADSGDQADVDHRHDRIIDLTRRSATPTAMAWSSSRSDVDQVTGPAAVDSG